MFTDNVFDTIKKIVKKKGSRTLESVSINVHSSIRICADGVTVYFDPWKIKGEPHDADIVCITHDHYDHFSPEDIVKVSSKHTVVVVPESCGKNILAKMMKEAPEFEDNTFSFMKPDSRIKVRSASIRAVAAYNVDKEFHKKHYNWLGYTMRLGGIKYYVAGDTDDNEDIRKITCDVALVPVGGTYTMTAAEAAAFINVIRPKQVVPMHYGDIVGTKEDFKTFKKLVDTEIEVVEKL